MVVLTPLILAFHSSQCKSITNDDGPFHFLKKRIALAARGGEAFYRSNIIFCCHPQ